jgi:phospholipase C
MRTSIHRALLVSTVGLACSFALGCSSSSSAPAAGTAGAAGAAGADAASSRGGSGGSGATGAHIKTVFLILMENTVWSSVRGSPDAPYLNGTLLSQASVAEAYKGAKDGNLHPSEPNYLWLEAGDNFGLDLSVSTADADPVKNHQGTTAHLVTQLEAANVTWRSYQEDIAGDVCPLTSVKNYAPKHNPMVFFDDVTNTNDPTAPRCIEHVRPLTELETDLAGGSKLGRYNFITPNQCNDMHTKCPPQNNFVRQGDDWLAVWVPKIMASKAYSDGGAIFVTWDEGGISAACPAANCPIGMFVLSPLAKGGAYSNTIAYDHSSTLKTVQEIFGVTPLLGGAAAPAVTDLADLFKSFP